MTGFETATVAYRNAALACQHAGPWIGGGHIAIGIAQCLPIRAGPRLMRRASDSRDRLMDDQCRVETMKALEGRSAALEELIRRTGRAEGGREMSAARASRAP